MKLSQKNTEAVFRVLEADRVAAVPQIMARVNLSKPAVYRALKRLTADGRARYVNGFAWACQSAYLRADLSAEIGVSQRTIREWQDIGILRSPTDRCISKAELVQMLQGYRVGAPVSDYTGCWTQTKTVRMLDVKPKLLSKWMRHGLPYFKIRRTVLYSIDEIIRYIKDYIRQEHVHHFSRATAARLREKVSGMTLPKR